MHRDHDAEELEVGIGAGFDLLDGLQKIIRALQREIGGLDRHQHVRRGHQGVDRDHAQSRRCVDEDVVVCVRGVLDLVLQPERSVDLTDQLRFQLGQGDFRRSEKEVGNRRGNDDVLEGELFADQHVEHRSRNASRIDVAHGGIGLRIEID